MRHYTRTQNVKLNAVYAIVCQAVIIVTTMVTRKVFLNHLGAELLGVNSLFSDVLVLFSFADLGIGTAIMFSMYKPIADNDDNKVKSLLLYYRRINNIVIISLLIISIGFVPFLWALKTDIPVSELIWYYFLFQLTNIAEYIWAYRENYVVACQNERLLSVVNLLYSLVKNSIQIIVIVVLDNFVFYLIVGGGCILIKKILVNEYIKKRYPVTRLIGSENLSEIERKEVLSKSKALLITRIGNLIINQTDGLVVSYIINVTTWGLASNYLMIKRAVFQMTDKIYDSVLPSMGNLVSYGDKKKELSVFLKYDFINTWIHTFCFTSLFCLSSPFVSLFFGNDVVLPESFTFVFFFAAFIDGLRSPISVIREANGTYEKDKWYTIVAAAVNLIVSIPLAMIYGLEGVFIGTICAMLVLHGTRVRCMFHDGAYNITALRYYLILLKNIIRGLAVCLSTRGLLYLIDLVEMEEVPCFFIKSFGVLILSNVLWILLNSMNKTQFSVIKAFRKKKLLKGDNNG